MFIGSKLLQSQTKQTSLRLPEKHDSTPQHKASGEIVLLLEPIFPLVFLILITASKLFVLLSNVVLSLLWYSFFSCRLCSFCGCFWYSFEYFSHSSCDLVSGIGVCVCVAFFSSNWSSQFSEVSKKIHFLPQLFMFCYLALFFFSECGSNSKLQAGFLSLFSTASSRRCFRWIIVIRAVWIDNFAIFFHHFVFCPRLRCR